MTNNSEVLILEQCGLYAYKNSISEDPKTARVVPLATLDEYLNNEFHSPYRRVLSRSKSLESFLKYAGRELVRKGFNQAWNDWNYEIMHVNSYLNDKRHDHNYFSAIQLSRVPQSGNKMLLVFYLKEEKRRYEAERANANRKQRISQESIERENREKTTNVADTAQSTTNGSTLSDQILRMYSTLVPAQKDMDDVKNVKNRIQRMVNQVWPDMNYQVTIFGSSANSLALKEADIDLCIVVPDDQYQRDISQHRNRLTRRAQSVYNMFYLASRLKDIGMEKVEAIGNAQVPICKFVDPQTGYQCDINTHNILGIENTKMIKKYCSLDARIRPLMYAIKYFVKQKNLNNPRGGTLSSYTYVIMLLRFLMSGLEEPVIPNLQLNAKQCVFQNCNVNISKPVLLFHDNHIMRCDTRYHNCMYVRSTVNRDNNMPFTGSGTLWEGHNNQTVGQLFYRFLQYYTSLDKFTLSIISANGDIVQPSELYPTNSPFVIQDPFLRSKNIARSCTEIGAEIIMQEFSRAFKMLKKGSTFAEICDPYINLKRPVDTESMEYRFSQKVVRTQQKHIEIKQDQRGDKVIDTTTEETKKLAKAFGLGLRSSDEESPSRTQIVDIKSTTHSTNTSNLVSSQLKQDIKTATNGVQFVAESKTLKTNGTKSEKQPANGTSSEPAIQKKSDNKPLLNLIETLLEFKPRFEESTPMDAFTKPCTDMTKLINSPATKDVSAKDVCYLLAQLNFLGDALAEKLSDSSLYTTPIINGSNSDSFFTPDQEAGILYMKELQEMMNAAEISEDNEGYNDEDSEDEEDESDDDKSFDNILLNVRGRENKHYDDDEVVKISYYLHSLSGDVDAYDIYVMLQWYGNVIQCQFLNNDLSPGWKITMSLPYRNIQQLPINPDFGHCEGRAYAVISD